MNRPLRVAFVGAGQMARHHLSAISRLQATQIVGVHDRVTPRAEEFAAVAQAPAFPSIDAMCVEARPDVVHVCTPPAMHFAAARAALDRGAHVYVEKPFALTTADAEALLSLARVRGRLVCAGHQLLRDRAFLDVMGRAAALGRIVQVDSHFAFRPAGVTAHLGPRAMAAQLVDILPHPLYALVGVLERHAAHGLPVELAWTHATATDVQAILRAGDVVGRLSVSLCARPVASSLTILGTSGSLTCDFVRSNVIGAGNPGTEALEKILNPMVEGVQLVSRTALSLGRRLSSGTSYPGLAETIASFHQAIRDCSVSPITPDHLLQVTRLFEQLVAHVDAAACRSQPSHARAPRLDKAALIAVTGARGFLGSRVVRALDRARGIGRTPDADRPPAVEWVTADLSGAISPDALAGVDVVVHAAAETSAGYEGHQRNTIDATRNLLHAMHSARVTRLVLVSSLSVLRPPRTPWECQDERTPRADDARALGPYVWGKSQQEALVEREGPALGIQIRIVRPGALIDWNDPELPGLMGRRLFGRWHLGLGRPWLPIAVCDVDRCATAIAWCATHFNEAPAVVNLFDPSSSTRGAVLERLRGDGWTGRVVWVPISLVSLGLVGARAMLAFSRGRLPERMAAWSVLRPRRYDGRVAAGVLDAATVRLPGDLAASA